MWLVGVFIFGVLVWCIFTILSLKRGNIYLSLVGVGILAICIIVCIIIAVVRYAYG